MAFNGGNASKWGYTPFSVFKGTRGPRGFRGQAGLSLSADGVLFPHPDALVVDPPTYRLEGTLETEPFTGAKTTYSFNDLDASGVIAEWLITPPSVEIARGVWTYTQAMTHNADALTPTALYLKLFDADENGGDRSLIAEAENFKLRITDGIVEDTRTLALFVPRTILADATRRLVLQVVVEGAVGDDLDFVYGNGFYNPIRTTLTTIVSDLQGAVGPTGASGTDIVEEIVGDFATTYVFTGASANSGGSPNAILLPSTGTNNAGAVMVQLPEDPGISPAVALSGVYGVSGGEQVVAGSVLIDNIPLLYVVEGTAIPFQASPLSMVVRGGTQPTDPILEVDVATGLTHAHQRFAHSVYFIPTGTFTGTADNIRNSTFIVASDFSTTPVIIELPSTGVAVGQIFYTLKNNSGGGNTLKIVVEGGGLINGSAEINIATAHARAGFMWLGDGYLRFTA